MDPDGLSIAGQLRERMGLRWPLPGQVQLCRRPRLAERQHNLNRSNCATARCIIAAGYRKVFAEVRQGEPILQAAPAKSLHTTSQDLARILDIKPTAH
jgi:hypothetical protein